MAILAVDTSTKICSVALRVDDVDTRVRTAYGTGIHSEKLFLFIEELLHETKTNIDDIVAILMAGGPGSYTGLRIGASGLKGLVYNRDAVLCSINTLAYFANCCRQVNTSANRIHGVLDARREHLYHQTFFTGDLVLEPVDNVEIIPIVRINDHLRGGDVIVGTGITRISDEIVKNYDTYSESIISAAGLFHFWDQRNEYGSSIVKKVAPDSFEPYYYSSWD